jgi:hypothetical protein
MTCKNCGIELTPGNPKSPSGYWHINPGGGIYTHCIIVNPDGWGEHIYSDDPNKTCCGTPGQRLMYGQL